MAWVAVAGLALAAGTTAYGLSQSAPAQPNLGQAEAETQIAEGEMQPEFQALQANAELGNDTLNPGFTKSTANASEIATIQKQITRLQNEAGMNNNGAAAKANRAKIASLQSQLASIGPGGTVYKNAQGQIVPQSQAMTQFTSAADVQGQIQNQLAAGKLATEQQFDPQFIAQALQEEQLANPQGTQARSELDADIQKQIANPPTSPVANEMSRQVGERVAAGNGLTPEQQSMLNTSVNQASSDRGGGNAPLNVGNELTTGFQGQQRGISNASAGVQELASGQTPDDIAYRANQQNISNLASFYNGATPQSEFHSLVGAGVGATPTSQAPAAPGMNYGAGQQGAGGAIQNYQLGIQQQANQTNPWMAGLSGVLGAANVAGAAGYQPFS